MHIINVCCILKLPIPSFSKFLMWFVMTNKYAWMYCIGKFEIIEVYLEISFVTLIGQSWRTIMYINQD